MELNDYQKKAMSTCMDSSRNMSYMAMGLVSEVGELTGKIAKAIRKGDILWFAAGIAEVMGWTLDKIAQENIDKLASRQKRGVIDGNGDNR